jgi:hypothetical protein
VPWCFLPAASRWCTGATTAHMRLQCAVRRTQELLCDSPLKHLCPATPGLVASSTWISIPAVCGKFTASTCTATSRMGANPSDKTRLEDVLGVLEAHCEIWHFRQSVCSATLMDEALVCVCSAPAACVHALRACCVLCVCTGGGRQLSSW